MKIFGCRGSPDSRGGSCNIHCFNELFYVLEHNHVRCQPEQRITTVVVSTRKNSWSGVLPYLMHSRMQIIIQNKSIPNNITLAYLAGQFIKVWWTGSQTDGRLDGCRLTDRQCYSDHLHCWHTDNFCHVKIKINKNIALLRNIPELTTYPIVIALTTMYAKYLTLNFVLCNTYFLNRSKFYKGRNAVVRTKVSKPFKFENISLSFININNVYLQWKTTCNPNPHLALT